MAARDIVRKKGERCTVVVITKEEAERIDYKKGLDNLEGILFPETIMKVKALKHGDMIRTENFAHSECFQFVINTPKNELVGAYENDGHGWIDEEISMFIEDPMDFYFFKHRHTSSDCNICPFTEFLGMDFHLPTHKEFLKKVCGRDIADNRVVQLYQGYYYVDAPLGASRRGRQVHLDINTLGIYLTAEGSTDIAKDPYRLESIRIMEEHRNTAESKKVGDRETITSPNTFSDCCSSKIVSLTKDEMRLENGQVFHYQPMTGVYEGITWWVKSDGSFIDYPCSVTPFDYLGPAWMEEYEGEGTNVYTPEYYAEYGKY